MTDLTDIPDEIRDAATDGSEQRDRSVTRLVDAYDGNVYRLLRDIGDHLGLSLAYVDRATVDAHVERTLTNAEWQAVSGQFRALDFDDYVGDHGSFRTAWIETVLESAGVPGYGYAADAHRIAEQVRL